MGKRFSLGIVLPLGFSAAPLFAQEASSGAAGSAASDLNAVKARIS